MGERERERGRQNRSTTRRELACVPPRIYIVIYSDTSARSLYVIAHTHTIYVFAVRTYMYIHCLSPLLQGERERSSAQLIFTCPPLAHICAAAVFRGKDITAALAREFRKPFGDDDDDDNARESIITVRRCVYISVCVSITYGRHTRKSASSRARFSGPARAASADFLSARRAERERKRASAPRIRTRDIAFYRPSLSRVCVCVCSRMHVCPRGPARSFARHRIFLFRARGRADFSYTEPSISVYICTV